MPTDEANARKLIAAGYSDQFVQMANDCSIWLFWYRPVGRSEYELLNKGTVFFVDAGCGPFGVTAYHVIDALQHAKRSYDDLGVQLGSLPLDPSALLLGHDLIRDVATFRIPERAIASLGKRPHVNPRNWPPPRPQEGKGVFFGGYRGPEDNRITPDDALPWDFWSGFGPVTGVFDDQLTVRFERANWVDRPGHSTPEVAADWGGTSGGPMFAIFEGAIVDYRLAGIVKEYWREVELLAFAPIDRIRADGTVAA